MLSKLKRSILALGCVVLLGLSGPAEAQREGQAFEPILATELKSSIPALLTLSLLDIDSRKLTDQKQADALFQKMTAATKDGQDRSPQALVTLFKDAASLLQFYLSQAHLKENRGRTKTAAAWMEKYAQLSADTSKRPDPKTLVLAKLGKFIRTDGTDGISELIPLKDRLTSNQPYLANIDLLVGYSLALAPPTAQQGMQIMNQATSQISVFGRLAQKLTEALVDFGLDADGNPMGQAKPGAETKLTYSVQIARGMPAGLQYQIMTTTIHIWSRANAGKTYKTPNFLKDGFVGVLPVEALREKEALGDIANGNFKDAGARYRKIATAFAQTEFAAALDERTWDIELLAYQKTGRIADLETAFMSFRDRYKSQGKKPFYTYLFESYRKAIDSVLDQSLSGTVNGQPQKIVAQVADRFSRIETNKAQATAIRTKVAQLYRNMKMFKEAVEIYVELGKEQPLKNFLLAIEAQSQLANWPTVPDFGKMAPEKNPERSRLLGFYELVNQLKKGEDWFILAHIGNLYKALGKNPEQIWVKALRTNINSKFAADAGGMLITEFYAANRFNDVIDMVHLFQSKRVSATLQGKAVDMRPLLGDSLFKGAAIDLQAQNFARAAKYLEEFIGSFSSEARVPQAHYSLAFAYRGQKKMPQALEICKQMVDRFPTHPLRPKVLMTAGDWSSLDKSTWEFGFFFYGKYIQDYKNEANVPQVRMTLADLYLKRKLYGWAARLYKEQSQAPNVSKDQQLAAAIKAMEIEEQFGEPGEAFKVAQRIVELAGTAEGPKIKAFAYMARFVANAKDLKGMQDIEPKLIPASKNNKEVADSLGLLRFKRAEILTQKILYTENNLTIKDPEAVIKKYFDRFESERRYYAAVCQLGVTLYCAPSMMRLTSVAKQALEAMDKVQIAETLGPSRINSFKVLKQLYFSKILQARKDYADQAMRLAKSGTTTPLWKDEIIKTLEYDEPIVAH